MTKVYKNPGLIEFEAVVQRNDGGGTWVDFPYDLKELYGVGNLVPVKAIFDNQIEYRGRLAKMGGDCAMLIVLKEIREKLGKDRGDRVHVKVELDDQPRELKIANDIQQVLKTTNQLEMFNSLAFSHRREYIRWVEGAKKPETRTRRIQKMCEMLASGKKDPR